MFRGERARSEFFSISAPRGKPLFALSGFYRSLPVNPRGIQPERLREVRNVLLGFLCWLGLFVSVFVLLAAVWGWQLGGLPLESLARMRGTAGVFALCFAAITVLSLKCFLLFPSFSQA